MNAGLTFFDHAPLVTALAINAADTQILYAGATLSQGGIYKTSDGGVTWARVANGLPNGSVEAIATDPDDPDMAYAALQYGGGVYVTTNGGGVWNASNFGLTSQQATGLAILPSQTSVTLYVATSDEGIFVSTDRAGSWSPASAGLPRIFGELSASPIVAGARDSTDVYVGTFGAGVFASHDAGETWTRASTGMRSPATVDLVAAPSDPHIVYTATHGGLFASTDAARSWRLVYEDAPFLALAVDPMLSTTLFAGTVEGVWKSVDGGVSWGVSKAAITNVGAVAVHPGDPKIVYATAREGLFRTVDGGDTWEQLLPGSPPLGNLLIDPATDDVYVGSSGALLRSRTGGATWETLAYGLADVVSAIAIDPVDPAILYAGVGDYGAVRSEDHGGTWTRIGLKNVFAFASVPGEGATLHAAAVMLPYTQGVFVTTDQGNHWMLDQTPGLTDPRVTRLVAGPAPDAILYAGANGVFALRPVCGDGILDLGETCDDGNSLDGDCCSANCQLEKIASPCTDSNACTAGDACDGAGSCVPGNAVDCGPCETCDSSEGCLAKVLTGCHQPTERFSGELLMSRGTTAKLRWQWTKGDATTLSDFGDPVDGDAYALCLFDESGTSPHLAFRASSHVGQCEGRRCWKQTGASSFKYGDRQQTPGGLDHMFLKSGPDGKAKLLVSGRGANLSLPTLPLALPARAQLQAENGQCWESQYSEVGTSRNDSQEFKAKAFQP